MSMTNDSIREFLRGCHYATLATQNENGSTHLTPVWYLFEDDRFYFLSNKSARKYKNIVARPTISLMVDSRRNQGSEQWVSASGSAEIISGEKSQDINLKVVKRYITETGLEDPVVGPVFSAAGEVTVSLKPDSWQSWEMKELDDAYFNGVLKQTPEKWFIRVD